MRRLLLSTALASLALPALADEPLTPARVITGGPAANDVMLGTLKLGSRQGGAFTITGPVNGAVDSATVGGAAISAILSSKAPLASPTFTGKVTTPSLVITGAGSTGSVDDMSVTMPNAAAKPVRDLLLSRAPSGQREINAADTRYAGGVVSDCISAGVGTDSGPAIRAARDAWIAAGAGGKLKVPAGAYCINTPSDMNLGGLSGMVFDASEAVFVTKNTAMVAFDFHNGLQATIKARFIDGGVFDSAASGPYKVDYGATADVVAAGGQEAIRVSGISGYTVDLLGQNYAGRLLRVTRARAGEPTTGGIKGTIRTTRGINLSRPRVAQSLYTDNGVNGFTGYWGHLDSVHNDFDAWGPSWFDVNDVAINYFDGAYAFTGITLGGVQVFKGGIIYVGDIDTNPSNTHVYVGPSPFTNRKSSFIDMETLSMLNGGNGLVVENTDPSGSAVNIRQVLMGGNACNTVVTLSNVKGAKLGINAQPSCQTAAVVNGSTTDDIRLDITAKGLSNSFAYVGPEVTGNVSITGNMADPLPGFSAVVVAGNTPVSLDANLSTTKGSSLTLFQSATNKVRWGSGSATMDAQGAVYGGNAASYVSPTVRGVPPTTSATPIDIQSFTSSGTWTKPTNAKTVRVLLQAPGGGAASGGRQASGTVSRGGSPGGPGGWRDITLAASDLPASIGVTIGAAGAGGPAVTTDSTAGSAGSAGGNVTFGTSSDPFYMLAGGGSAGGATTAGAAGAGDMSLGAGNASSVSGGTVSTVSLNGAYQALPGGAGAGQTATPGSYAGGRVIHGQWPSAQAFAGVGGVGSTKTDAIPPTAAFLSRFGIHGGGGPGGWANADGTAGAGAAGLRGGGGGGGGGSLNGNPSGAGGAGGAGYVVIETEF